jgi:ABC-type polysaccharide/polyol phosphate transport system ATPase subunit
MIQLRQVCKTYATQHGPRQVLRDVSFDLKRGEKLGVVGSNGSGKSTLVRIMSGAARPTSGVVTRGMSVSWPLAFGGAFQGSLTGRDNIKFVSRVYGVDWRSTETFVEGFAELGRYLREPVKTYSSGMRARLAFALSLAIEFDCFLIDEVFAVGDARFQQKCRDQLFGERSDRAMLIVSHDEGYIREHCSVAAVLKGGLMSPVLTVDEALERYRLS